MDLKSLRFAPTHEWVRLEGNIATVGISKFAVDQLTDLVMIELPAPGTRLIAGKSFGEIESVKAVSDLYSPLTGEVIEINNEVTSNVALLAEDPYDHGWLIKMKVAEPVDTSELMDLNTYESQVANESH